MEPITYRYSKANSIFLTLFACLLIGLSLPNLVRFVNAGGAIDWLLILGFDLIIGAFLIYTVIKRLIPALQNKIAVEINSKEIISYINDATIEWKEIKNIEIKSGKTSSYLLLTFKLQTERGDYLRIPFEMLTGNNGEIHDNVMEYFKSCK